LYTVLQSLLVLNAVVWETLRLYSPVYSGLERAVPRGGLPVTGAGCWLSEATTVSVPAYALQSDGTIFLQPLVWQLAQLITTETAPLSPLTPSSCVWDTGSGGSRGDGSAAEVEDRAGAAAPDDVTVKDEERHGKWTCYDNDVMRAHMLVFGKGMRACLGQTIALMELKLVTAVLVQRFPAV
jgi:cytochrome P450